MLISSRFAHVTLCLFAAVLLAIAPRADAEVDISGFGDDAETSRTWFAVNDSVMGGVSTGQVARSQAGNLVFTGNLSMQNNGGFASIRTRDTADVLQGHDTIQIRLRGDGRAYYLSLRDKNRGMAASHRRAIQTVKDQWIDVAVTLDEFNYTRFGREIDRPELTSGEVVSLGITLADNKPGPFKLEIASILASSTQQQADDSIVGLATRAGNFTTLLAAAKAAGLDEALANPDANITLFAPTDAAFAALPEGTVESLLEEQNRSQLRALLLNHVVEGRVTLSQTVTTPTGQTLTIAPKAGATIGNATILQADLRASNGIVHAIDAVLLPTSMQDTAQGRAARIIQQAIATGVPAYNQGDIAACAEVYEIALQTLARDHRAAIGEYTARVLDLNLQLNERTRSADDRAWSYRSALDQAYEVLSN